MNAHDSQEREIARALARVAGLPFVDLERYRISPGILRRLPRGVARRERCVPLIANIRRVVLVCDDPVTAFRLATDPTPLGVLDLAPLDPRLAGRGRALSFALATPSALARVLDRREALPV